MKAKVVVEKSFDNGQEFTKEYAVGDFENFFRDEGGYLDRLAIIAKNKGKAGEGFVVKYTVTVEV